MNHPRCMVGWLVSWLTVFLKDCSKDFLDFLHEGLEGRGFSKEYSGSFVIDENVSENEDKI